MQDKIIVISAPAFFEGEAELLNRLFKGGLKCLHLRKPGSTQVALMRLVDKIDLEFRKRITIHYQQELVRKMELKGIHFSYPEILSNLNLRDYNCSLSCSLHNWQELAEVQEAVDYCFISPVYNSVSKAGYHANETLKKVPSFARNVYALGGITHVTCTEAIIMGYSGVAVLGHLWEDKRCTMQRFEQLQKKLKTYGD